MAEKTEPVSGEEEQFTKEQAKQEVEATFQRVCQTGGVNFESSAFKEISDLLEKDTIEPLEAVIRARQIESSRQDYR